MSTNIEHLFKFSKRLTLPNFCYIINNIIILKNIFSVNLAVLLILQTIFSINHIEDTEKVVDIARQGKATTIKQK